MMATITQMIDRNLLTAALILYLADAGVTGSELEIESRVARTAARHRHRTKRLV